MKSKTALITGGAKGIGAACALELAKNGFHIVLHYHTSRPQAEMTAQQIRQLGVCVQTVYADLACEDEIDRLAAEAAEAFCGVDVLVNNAGLSLIKPVEDMAAAEYDALFSVNMRAPYLLTKRMLPCLRRSPAGRIINISSVWGVQGASCEVAYSASKAALIGFTRALANEVAPQGITVNAVAPGVIDTDMNAHLTPEDRMELCAATPLNRLGTTEEVAAAVAFLASPQAGFITGQTLGVDGGF